MLERLPSSSSKSLLAPRGEAVTSQQHKQATTATLIPLLCLARLLALLRRSERGCEYHKLELVITLAAIVCLTFRFFLLISVKTTNL